MFVFDTESFWSTRRRKDGFEHVRPSTVLQGSQNRCIVSSSEGQKPKPTTITYLGFLKFCSKFGMSALSEAISGQFAGGFGSCL
ncbi:hypothetical protein M404DRAFT_438549 [Pisolithus tinctorius Marx 270]|uniref:Uncharacterized protein n=1 Tax=Pisolithus tinctorius Marx 270 TaxID=870435 RepID=A0A0C3PFI8_PISTI|nr:hypothetical protein M404DRAFT_438549 [Pisolithus tinctorius Marx 270]